MGDQETNDSGEVETESVINRPRAALTRTDREYLFGEKNYDTDQAERNAQYRIRQHLKHSLTDFGIVALNDDNLLEDAMRKHAEDLSEYPPDMESVEATYTFPILTSRMIHARAADQGTPFEALLESSMELGVEAAIIMRDDDDAIPIDVNIDISIDTEIPAETDITITDIIYGETTATRFYLYVTKADNALDKLRERLQREGQTIDFAEDADFPRDSIGPDDPILNLEESIQQQDE